MSSKHTSLKIFIKASIDDWIDGTVAIRHEHGNKLHGSEPGRKLKHNVTDHLNNTYNYT